MSEDTMEMRMRKVEDTLARIETKLDVALEKSEDHEIRLRAVEAKSGKRWDNLVGQIITLLVAAVFGALAGKLL